jgi:hypothetical protein
MKYRLKGENGDVHPTNTMVKQISVATENRTAMIETIWSSVAFGRDPMIPDLVRVIEVQRRLQTKHEYM